MEAFQAVRANYPYRIVAIGTVAQQWNTLRHASPILALTGLPMRELQALAQHAFAFFLPSPLVGLPEPFRASVLEGKQVMTSNTAENRTRYRETAVYYDPSDAYSIECALRRLLTYNYFNHLLRAPAEVIASTAQTPGLPQLPAAALRAYNADWPLYFLHIPKAAGTSVRVMVEDAFADDGVCKAYFPSDLSRIPLAQLERFRLFRGHLGAALYPLLSTPLNTFTWMREPLDLLLSHYAFRIQEHLIPKSMTFPEWLDIAEPEPVCNFLTTGLTSPAANPAPTLLSGAASVVEQCFLLGLVERHEDSINLLCYHLGLYPPEVTAALNRSQKRTQLADYTEAVRERAEALVRADRALYDWAAPLIVQRLAEMEAALQPEIAARFGATERPTTAQMRTLLRERFFHKQHATPLRAEIAYTFDQPLIGEGWYERQPLEPDRALGCSRWIAGDTGRALLYLPLQKERDCVLRVGIAEVYTPAALDGLRLAVNGVSVPLQRTSQGHPSLASAVVCEATLPQEALCQGGHLTQLAFTTNASLRPIDRDPFMRDPRKFTVALHWITVHAVDPS